jgi:ABC-type uncharacterized transport system auxiliary subunit
MTLKKICVLLVLAGLFCLNGCLSVQNIPSPEVSLYILKNNQIYSGQDKLPYVLKIKRFVVAPEYNVNNIVYQTERYQRQEYPYHQWRTHPGALIANCLQHAFQKSSLYTAVIGEESDLIPSHLLEGSVDAIYEKDTDKNWFAVLHLTITLIQRNAENGRWEVLIQESFVTQKEVHKRDPEHVVKAMNEALGQLSLKIQEKTYQELSGQAH